ncbi:MAG: magnesium transporter CorA family protein [Planctomycetaceae bacterium]|jgi:magnesium transporter|nr:magnesium transporter CorA family protein [Planctomycetaceae bacterium]
MIIKYELYDGKLRSCESGDATVLIYADPSEEERNYLIKELALDEHTLTSALDPDELSRVEFEPEHLAVIYKRPKSYTANDNFLFRVSSTGFYLFKDKVVIVLCGDAPIFDHSKNLSQINSLSDLLLKLMQRSIGQFNGHMKAINLIIDELEKKLVASMGNRHLLNLFKLEQSMVYYLSAITTNGSLIERLRTSAGKIGFSTEQVEAIEDLIVDNTQCYKQAEIISTIMAGMMDARASVVNNNLSMLMKHLTILSLVFMPLNLIASVGGMSEYTMFSECIGLHAGLAYLIFMAAMCFAGYCMYWLMAKAESED